MLNCVKTLTYLCNCKSKESSICNAMDGHCIQAMKVVHYHANGHFDWLTDGHQSVNPSREAVSILYGKYNDLHLSILWLY